MRVVDFESQIRKFLNREVRKMEQGVRYGNYAGRVERKQKEIVQEVTTMAMSVLAMHGVLVSDRERTELQGKIYAHVMQSVEIEAKLVEIMSRGTAA